MSVGGGTKLLAARRPSPRGGREGTGFTANVPAELIKVAGLVSLFRGPHLFNVLGVRREVRMKVSAACDVWQLSRKHVHD